LAGILTADDFLPHIGKRFLPRGHDCVLTLVSIDQGPFPGSENLPRLPFTLLFSGGKQNVLPEGLYEFEVNEGPMVEVYVSPIQTFAHDRQDYQGVFN
jgi:hypothetical protein